MALRPIAFAAALTLAALLAPVDAQAQPADAPPRLPAGSGAAAVVSPAATQAPSSRPAAPVVRNASPAAPIVEDEALADLPPAQKTAPETRIEQRRQGNRIVEVTVTPAGSTRSYTIVNRDGQRPQSVQELSGGLSTPRFFKFEF